ncbi:O-antigen polysaccharide polymerase Wzy [Halpernia sp.]|uniref:O-antigen polysaccharide polymerase Wzy n=1 Tax=Halpernia sp. TaxID=2782209 RepID=UPI003A8D51A3
MKLNIKLSTFLIAVSLIVYLILYAFLQSERMNVALISKILIFNLLIIVIFFLQYEPYSNLRKQYIRISTIFLLGYCVVFFQFNLDYVLGNVGESFTRFWVNYNIVPKALIISSIGLVCFLLGYSIKKQFPTRKKIEITPSKLSLNGYNVLTALFLLIYLITINPLYIAGGYGVMEMGEPARFCAVLFELSFTAGIIQHILNLSSDNRKEISPFQFVKSLGLLRLSFLIVYTFTVLASGDRGPVIYLATGIVASYIVLTKWKISMYKFIGVFFLASVIVSSLTVLRNNINSNVPISVRLFEAFIGNNKSGGYVSLENINSISGSTLELSTSVRTLHIAVNEVPQNRPFFYGKFQMLKIVTIIPLGQQAIKYFFHLKDTELTSEKYISELVGAKKGSEGTSCIADLYLDFGLVGVILVMFLFGYYVRFIEVEALGKNHFGKVISIIAFVIICQYAIYIPRATILFNLRNIVWVWSIIKIVNILTPKGKQRITIE